MYKDVFVLSIFYRHRFYQQNVNGLSTVFCSCFVTKTSTICLSAEVLTFDRQMFDIFQAEWTNQHQERVPML